MKKSAARLSRSQAAVIGVKNTGDLAMNRRGFLQAIFATVAITTGLAKVKLDAITKTLPDTAYPVGHVYRYGADPKGVMDSSFALNAAIAEARGTGATVHFPPGEYRFSQTMVFQQDPPIEIHHSKIILEAAQPAYIPLGARYRVTNNQIWTPEFTRLYQQGISPVNIWGAA